MATMGQGTFQGGAQARALPIERPGCSSGMGPGTSGQCTSVIIWVARQQPAPSSSDCSAARQQHGPQVLHKLRLPGRAEEDAAVSEVWMVHHLPGGGVGQSMGRWSVPRSLGPAAGEASGSGEQCVCGGGGGAEWAAAAACRRHPRSQGGLPRCAGCWPWRRGQPPARPPGPLPAHAALRDAATCICSRTSRLALGLASAKAIGA